MSITVECIEARGTGAGPCQFVFRVTAVDSTGVPQTTDIPASCDAGKPDIDKLVEQVVRAVGSELIAAQASSNLAETLGRKVAARACQVIGYRAWNEAAIQPGQSPEGE